ncbi:MULTISPECIES: hypothetical protein [Caballeronia]|jgi:hypothetical protein|uniref:hypothetical protein n=1 Tax=Caballeronia TaxID=1827195 RepID=UPI001588CE43|nr:MULTISPECIES: hypothetical protein [Caballeronia]MCG7404559.1 hypothetical protein [Caballeronia zhejiangensis]MCI1046444.1 hypothetical protein [Caballeronia zhejiangensis]MDR5764356.1 hypothetical protein [Caballeronia sp. LZ028]MDR5788126.1 hypothetical protein [Caballeronia sp. LP003]
MAQECMFSDNYQLALEFPTVSLSGLAPPASGFKFYDHWFYSNDAGVQSVCNPGRDGQALLGETTSTVVSKLDVAQVSFYSNTYTAQMFPTSYNGLFYLVAIQVDADIHGNDCEEIILGPLPPPPLETVLASPDDHHDSSCMQGIGWRFFTIFGVSPDFVKPSSAVSFHSNNGEHGKFRLSGTTGDKDLRIVTISSINIMVGTLNP